MDQYCEALFLLAYRCAREFGAPLPKRLLSVGDPDSGWGAQLNPTSETIDGVGPFQAKVTWNGFPAGVLDPGGGVIAAGEAANEREFRAWLASYQGAGAAAGDRGREHRRR